MKELFKKMFKSLLIFGLVVNGLVINGMQLPDPDAPDPRTTPPPPVSAALPEGQESPAYIGSGGPTISPEAPTSDTPTTTTIAPRIDFVRAKNDIIANIRHQYRILHNLTEEFKAIWREETSYASGAYKNFSDNISWYFTAPDDTESADLDRALGQFYPFGGALSDYVDSMDKMNDYCSKHDARLEALKSWIRRKYRYNMLIQVTFNIIVSKIDEKNDYFCNGTHNREEFVRNIAKVKQINHLLVPVKERLLDSAVYIQNSTFKLPKIGRICCSFWEYMRTLVHAVKGTEVVDFVTDMTSHYFAGATKYVCFLYPYGTSLCQDVEAPPKMPHKYQSLVMELVLTLGEIASLGH